MVVFRGEMGLYLSKGNASLLNVKNVISDTKVPLIDSSVELTQPRKKAMNMKESE